MRRRAALELARKYAMRPRTLEMHFARLAQEYKKYDITSPRQLFNIDESGVLTRNGGRGKGKANMRASGRSNATELEFASNAEHLTVMPVLSADVHTWPLVVIMPGSCTKYAKMLTGTRKPFTTYSRMAPTPFKNTHGEYDERNILAVG